MENSLKDISKEVSYIFLSTLMNIIGKFKPFIRLSLPTSQPRNVPENADDLTSLKILLRSFRK
eukprot:snap_masked-scaffold_41-processed-gene-0.2-mRNA-1 protein AED:1.00 eAED:1.00 QI:0/0/0/0/1/1/2/0/62